MKETDKVLKRLQSLLDDYEEMRRPGLASFHGSGYESVDQQIAAMLDFSSQRLLLVLQWGEHACQVIKILLKALDPHEQEVDPDEPGMHPRIIRTRAFLEQKKKLQAIADTWEEVVTKDGKKIIKRRKLTKSNIISAKDIDELLSLKYDDAKYDDAKYDDEVMLPF